MTDFKKISKGYLINKTPILDLSLKQNKKVLGYNKNAFYYRGCIIEFMENSMHYYDKNYLIGGLIYCGNLSTQKDREGALIKTVAEIEKQLTKEKQKNEYKQIIDKFEGLQEQIKAYNLRYNAKIEIEIRR